MADILKDGIGLNEGQNKIIDCSKRSSMMGNFSMVHSDPFRQPHQQLPETTGIVKTPQLF